MKIVSWGNRYLVGGFFLMGGKSNFIAREGDPPSPVGKTLLFHCMDKKTLCFDGGESLTSSKNQIIGPITYSYMEIVTPISRFLE